ncbi:MAG: pyruvate, water dikinase [Desulfobacterales bacterium]|nr:pyruvate, water dikinase [Desulfobacterales bacterium]
MGKWATVLQKLGWKKKTSELPDIDVDDLRIAFKARYHNFKLLLNANNKALEIMAEIEQALQGRRPFGMSFVKSRCIAISVKIFLLIKNLNELSDNKYQAINERFDLIQKQISSILNQKKISKDIRLIIPLEHIYKEMSDIVGSKMSNLGEIRNKINLTVPSGFVITASVYEHFMSENDLQTEIDQLFIATDINDMEALYNLSAEIQTQIINADIPQSIYDAIQNALEILKEKEGKSVQLAMRSSAIGEDTAETSFAGQYDSLLNVSIENVCEAYKKIVSSKYSVQAINYRLAKGLRDEDLAMCVGCIVMVNASCGGVIYTRNPVHFADDRIFINAAWGLPKSIVDGASMCDLFVISRKQPLSIELEQIHEKNKKTIFASTDGVCEVDIEEKDRNRPCLTHEQVIQLAEMAITIESYYQNPQDIEWAIDQNGNIYWLQARPLKHMDAVHDQFAAMPLDTEHIIAYGGVTASPGVAYGAVQHVSSRKDIIDFQEGAILVIEQAFPSFASLLSKASAVISEQGSFAGHLANVAREFQIPAIFGLKDIYKQLKSNEYITIDADNRSIYRGKQESILASAHTEKKNLMVGSPVFETLKTISDYIISLNLLDPDSSHFAPEYCQTYHDITRFSHEKAVYEMFNFGKEHQFSERSSKQLFYKVPMQWWILNLDDGFKQEVTKKYVTIDNIASIPMLALWEGILAIPWEGPPPIDGKGFASIMFQATTNTALNTGTQSKYNDRNYFMISKQFCSLSSRLGFHFSTLEALVSDRTSENYVTYRFKGGAADYQRRLKRVAFIGDIIEAYGFKVDIKEDSLSARVEGKDQEFMKERLKILGYLTMHTRQLDMIMTNPSLVEYYNTKIHKDIAKVLAKENNEPMSS